ncbi:hypothetical protein LCL98_25005 [Rossellomorea aquimaris]|nr:hypothetical protein [Rossellomorea aquimaris]
MKSSYRGLIKEQLGVTESINLIKNCKKCYYHGSSTKVCQIHMLKTKITEICPNFTNQRRAQVILGGAVSPR